MIHCRKDYNRIQDPANKIGEDEPVFLLRAKDEFAPIVIKLWADLVAASGDTDLANKVTMFAGEMEKWQMENGCKTPDTPASEME